MLCGCHQAQGCLKWSKGPLVAAARGRPHPVHRRGPARLTCASSSAARCRSSAASSLAAASPASASRSSVACSSCEANGERRAADGSRVSSSTGALPTTVSQRQAPVTMRQAWRVTPPSLCSHLVDRRQLPQHSPALGPRVLRLRHRLARLAPRAPQALARVVQLRRERRRLGGLRVQALARVGDGRLQLRQAVLRKGAAAQAKAPDQDSSSRRWRDCLRQ